MIWPRHQLPVHSPVSARAVAAAWRGVLFGAGSGREKLIETLRSYFGAADVLLLDSGTSALTLALRAAAEARPGAPVALPAYGCYDLATATLGAGLRAVLYDVDPATLGPDWGSLGRALQHGPCAVVAVHLYGIPVDVAAIAAFVGSEIVVVEDAAQGIGAMVRGRPVGASAPLGVLSFGRGKGVTGGGGGALMTGGREAERWRERLSEYVHGRRRGQGDAARLTAQWALARPAWYGALVSVPWLHLGETRYRAPKVPQAVSDAAVAALSVVWSEALATVATRRANAKRLLAGLATGAWRPVSGPADAEPSYLRLPVVLDRDAGEIVDRAAKRLGAMPGYPRTLSDLPEFSGSVVNIREPLPGARLLAGRLVTFPTHSQLSEADLSELEVWFRSADRPRPHGASPARPRPANALADGE